jgi:hypothetical protein
MYTITVIVRDLNGKVPKDKDSNPRPHLIFPVEDRLAENFPKETLRDVLETVRAWTPGFKVRVELRRLNETTNTHQEILHLSN